MSVQSRGKWECEFGECAGRSVFRAWGERGEGGVRLLLRRLCRPEQTGRHSRHKWPRITRRSHSRPSCGSCWKDGVEGSLCHSAKPSTCAGDPGPAVTPLPLTGKFPVNSAWHGPDSPGKDCLVDSALGDDA
ncbi:unnamed protein product [Eretmochelys imbricata]